LLSHQKRLGAQGEAVAVAVEARYGRCLGSSRRREKGLEMGKRHLEYFIGCGVFCR